MATDLLRFLKDSPEHGLPLSALPERLLDPDSLTVLAGDGLVEFGHRQDEATLARGELISAERWHWSSWIGAGRKPIGKILQEIRSSGEEHYVRLTSRGRLEASRTKSEARGEDSQDELLDLLSELSPLESRIVRYLWEIRTAYLSALCGPDRPWRDPVEPASQVKAIRRLGERFLTLGSRISLSIRNDLVILDRSPDK
jgi:hypothetical protein